MALAIKAIPTLYGKDANRFRERAERVEKEVSLRPTKDRSKDPFVMKMHKMLKLSGF